MSTASVWWTPARLWTWPARGPSCPRCARQGRSWPPAGCRSPPTAAQLPAACRSTPTSTLSSSYRSMPPSMPPTSGTCGLSWCRRRKRCRCCRSPSPPTARTNSVPEPWWTAAWSAVSGSGRPGIWARTRREHGHCAWPTGCRAGRPTGLSRGASPSTGTRPRPRHRS